MKKMELSMFSWESQVEGSGVVSNLSYSIGQNEISANGRDELHGGGGGQQNLNSALKDTLQFSCFCHFLCVLYNPSFNKKKTVCKTDINKDLSRIYCDGFSPTSTILPPRTT